MWEILCGKNSSTVSKDEIFTIIIWCTDRMNFSFAEFLNGIHVCNKSQFFSGLITGSSRENSIDKTLVIQNHFGKSEIF